MEFSSKYFGFFAIGVVVGVIFGILQDWNFVFRLFGDFVDFLKGRVGAFNIGELLLSNFVFCASYL